MISDNAEEHKKNRKQFAQNIGELKIRIDNDDPMDGRVNNGNGGHNFGEDHVWTEEDVDEISEGMGELGLVPSAPLHSC